MALTSGTQLGPYEVVELLGGGIVPRMDFTQAMRVLAAFDRHRVEYVLVGSMAMAAQGLVRATRDMDVFVASPEGDFWIDILARLGEAFRFADLESETLEVEGIRIRVATPRMLYRMKRNTVRPQDRLDAEVLRQRFGLEEE